MNVSRQMVLVGMFCVALSGCGQKEQTAVPASDAKQPVKASVVATPAAAPAAAADGDKVGIAECDAYIAKYEACIKDKVPAAAQAAMKTSFDAQRKAWRDAAKNADSRATLAAACTQANTLAKQAMSAYGCNWQ